MKLHRRVLLAAGCLCRLGLADEVAPHAAKGRYEHELAQIRERGAAGQKALETVAVAKDASPTLRVAVFDEVCQGGSERAEGIGWCARLIRLGPDFGRGIESELVSRMAASELSERYAAASLLSRQRPLAVTEARALLDEVLAAIGEGDEVEWWEPATAAGPFAALAPTVVAAAVDARIKGLAEKGTEAGPGLLRTLRLLRAAAKGSGPLRVRALAFEDPDAKVPPVLRKAALAALLSDGDEADCTALTAAVTAAVTADLGRATAVLEGWKERASDEYSMALLPSLLPILVKAPRAEALEAIGVVRQVMTRQNEAEADARTKAGSAQQTAVVDHSFRLKAGRLVCAALDRPDGGALAQAVVDVLDACADEQDYWTLMKGVRTRDPETLREVLRVGLHAVLHAATEARAMAWQWREHSDPQVRTAALAIIERADYFIGQRVRLDRLEAAARATPGAPNDFVRIVYTGDHGEPDGKGVPYRLVLPNGTARKGTTDAQGVLIEENLPSGTCVLMPAGRKFDTWRVEAGLVPKPGSRPGSSARSPAAPPARTRPVVH